jgi:hypothetical protein
VKLRADPDIIDATRAKSPIDAARYALKAWSTDVFYFAPDFRQEHYSTDDGKATKMFKEVCEGLLKFLPEQISKKRIKNAWFIITPTVLSKFEGYTTAWGAIGGGAAGAGGDSIFWENGQTVTTSYTITAGQNAGTFGPVTVNSGAIVTVPSGSVWTVV